MDIHSLLQNWARWVRLRPVQGHCRSIEHRFKFKRIDDTKDGWGAWETTPPPIPLPAVDVLAALEVEKVMRFLPRKHRLALRFEYVDRMPWKLACKRLSIGYDRWLRHLGRAQAMVENLTRARKTRILPAQLDIPAQPRPLRPLGATGVAETA